MSSRTQTRKLPPPPPERTSSVSVYRSSPSGNSRGNEIRQQAVLSGKTNNRQDVGTRLDNDNNKQLNDKIKSTASMMKMRRETAEGKDSAVDPVNSFNRYPSSSSGQIQVSRLVSKSHSNDPVVSSTKRCLPSNPVTSVDLQSHVTSPGTSSKSSVILRKPPRMDLSSLSQSLGFQVQGPPSSSSVSQHLPVIESSTTFPRVASPKQTKEPASLPRPHQIQTPVLQSQSKKGVIQMIGEDQTKRNLRLESSNSSPEAKPGNMRKVVPETIQKESSRFHALHPTPRCPSPSSSSFAEACSSFAQSYYSSIEPSRSVKERMPLSPTASDDVTSRSNPREKAVSHEKNNMDQEIESLNCLIDYINSELDSLSLGEERQHHQPQVPSSLFLLHQDDYREEGLALIRESLPSSTTRTYCSSFDCDTDTRDVARSHHHSRNNGYEDDDVVDGTSLSIQQKEEKDVKEMDDDYISRKKERQEPSSHQKENEKSSLKRRIIRSEEEDHQSIHQKFKGTDDDAVFSSPGKQTRTTRNGKRTDFRSLSDHSSNASPAVTSEEDTLRRQTSFILSLEKEQQEMRQQQQPTASSPSDQGVHHFCDEKTVSRVSSCSCSTTSTPHHECNTEVGKSPVGNKSQVGGGDHPDHLHHHFSGDDEEEEEEEDEHEAEQRQLLHYTKHDDHKACLPGSDSSRVTSSESDSHVLLSQRTEKHSFQDSTDIVIDLDAGMSSSADFSDDPTGNDALTGEQSSSKGNLSEEDSAASGQQDSENEVDEGIHCHHADQSVSFNQMSVLEIETFLRRYRVSNHFLGNYRAIFLDLDDNILTDE